MYTWFIPCPLNPTIPPGHFDFVHASECVCGVYTCAGLTACVCFEGHCHVLGSWEEGAPPCSNQGALIPVYPSVIYQYMRSTGNREAGRADRCTAHTERQWWYVEWQEESAATDSSDWQAGGQIDREVCTLQQEHAAFCPIDRRTQGQTGRVTDSMRATDGWTDAWWCCRSRVRHWARYSV